MLRFKYLDSSSSYLIFGFEFHISILRFELSNSNGQIKNEALKFWQLVEFLALNPQLFRSKMLRVKSEALQICRFEIRSSSGFLALCAHRFEAYTFRSLTRAVIRYLLVRIVLDFVVII